MPGANFKSRVIRVNFVTHTNQTKTLFILMKIKSRMLLGQADSVTLGCNWLEISHETMQNIEIYFRTPITTYIFCAHFAITTVVAIRRILNRS